MTVNVYVWKPRGMDLSHGIDKNHLIDVGHAAIGINEVYISHRPKVYDEKINEIFKGVPANVDPNFRYAEESLKRGAADYTAIFDKLNERRMLHYWKDLSSPNYHLLFQNCSTVVAYLLVAGFPVAWEGGNQQIEYIARKLNEQLMQGSISGQYLGNLLANELRLNQDSLGGAFTTIVGTWLTAFLGSTANQTWKPERVIKLAEAIDW